MSSILHIKTKASKQENEGEITEPVSPIGQYYTSKLLSICILAVLEFEVPIDVATLLPQLQQFFLLMNPRFSSIMMCDSKGKKQWKRVEVNVEDHIICPSFPNAIAGETYDDWFDEYLTKMSIEALPQDKPLWELHIINYPTSKAGGHAIFKLHHALGDGYSLMASLLACVRRADNPSLPLTFPSIGGIRNNNSGSRLMCGCGWLSAVYKGAFDFGWSLLKSSINADDKTPIRSGNKGVGFHPIKISTIQLSLQQIKLIKTKLGTTVNDVLMGVIFYGVRLYMKAIDKNSESKNSSKSTALVPLNTRNVGGYISPEELKNATNKLWGNQYSVLHVSVPELTNYRCSNPLDFVYKAQKQIKRLRNSPVLYLNAKFIDIIRKCRGPEVVAENMYRQLNNSSFVISNIIGPVEQVTLADHVVKGMYFTSSGVPQSLIVSIMSYMQRMRIGLAVEEGFIDSQRLKSCIQKAFELIYEAATKKE